MDETIDLIVNKIYKYFISKADQNPLIEKVTSPNCYI